MYYRKYVNTRGQKWHRKSHLTKEYRCTKENLIMYNDIANTLLKCFTHVEIQHIPHMENQDVNDLA